MRRVPHTLAVLVSITTLACAADPGSASATADTSTTTPAATTCDFGVTCDPTTTASGDPTGADSSSTSGSDPTTTTTSSSSSSSASSDTTTTTDADVSTDFPADENPISQGGIWVNGATDGLSWHDVRTTPGEAFGASTVGGYDDCVAHIDPSFRDFAPDQFAEAVVSRVVGYAPGVSHEVELLMRFSITPNDAHGYEVLWAFDGHLAIVRWNGPLGDYTPLLDNVDIGPAVDGDVLRAEIIGDVITVMRNGELVATGPSNATWTDGQPGIGFWPTTGATPASYGWKHFAAGDL